MAHICTEILRGESHWCVRGTRSSEAFEAPASEARASEAETGAQPVGGALESAPPNPDGDRGGSGSSSGSEAGD